MVIVGDCRIYLGLGQYPFTNVRCVQTEISLKGDALGYLIIGLILYMINIVFNPRKFFLIKFKVGHELLSFKYINY